MDTLQDRIKALTGNKRTFLLMRIAGLDVDLSKRLTDVTRGTYNSWFKNDGFALLYHDLPILIQDYRLEAVQMLRRDNQLEAVLLEGKILATIKAEIDTGIYLNPKVNCLLRTHLAREVYSKLMTDLDIVPEVKILTWAERINLLPHREPKKIEQGDTIDGEFSEISCESEEHPKGDNVSEVQSLSDEAQATAAK